MLRTGITALGIVTFSFASAWAQTTARVSVDSNGVQGNNGSGAYYRPTSISADGRYVAFFTRASNLVPGDTNGAEDVFVHDRQTGTTTRVSVDSAGLQANFDCWAPSISADGRYVAFWSLASNLVQGDTNGTADVFVRDGQTGATTRVSLDSAGLQGNAGSGDPSISADGRYVAFDSGASNLVPGDTNGAQDVFVHDRQTGTTMLVSVDSSGLQGNRHSSRPSISADGRYVAFTSDAANLVPGDTNGITDTFVHDCQTGATRRVSVDSAGLQADGASYGFPSISADGRFVAFENAATNLVPGDTNGWEDVFVHDWQTGVTTRVSVGSLGQQANFIGEYPSISADGRFVAFASEASNLVPGDTNGDWDTFVHDCQTGVTARVSVDSAGVQGNGASSMPSISADGRCVAFWSLAGFLVPGDTNNTDDIFVHDRGAVSAFTPLCLGDGTGPVCPCANTGSPGHGCENSLGTGGALLTASGVASLSSDTVQLTSSSELPTALSIVLQGSSVIAPVNFGDGLRCAGGNLKRLYTKHAIGGVMTAPQAGDQSISVRSAMLGDAIPLGATRAYQVYYRDPNLVFCPGGFNVTNAVAIAWGG
jgi:Tol biopolymer transport system component